MLDFKRMLQFELNIGAKEKQYRLYGGIALIVISIFFAWIPVLLIGLIMVGTGYSGWCPVYSGLNKNTASADANAESASTTEDSEQA